MTDTNTVYDRATDDYLQAEVTFSKACQDYINHFATASGAHVVVDLTTAEVDANEVDNVVVFILSAQDVIVHFVCNLHDDTVSLVLAEVENPLATLSEMYSTYSEGYQAEFKLYETNILDSAKALMNVQNRTKGWRYLHEALTV